MKLPFLLNSVSRCNSPKEVEQVFGKLIKALPNLEGNTVSHCLNLLAKKEVNQPRFLWQKTAELLTDPGDNGRDREGILSRYEVKDVCIILNSFAKVDHLFVKLIEASTRIITREIRSIHSRDLCNVVHSLGKLNQMSPLSKILKRVFPASGSYENVNRILKRIEGCNEKDFSMLMRVLLFNSESLEFDEVTKKLLSSLSDRYDHLSDQTLAILANSLAVYGKDDNGTLALLAPIITHRLGQGCFTPQCLAQISNGYAKLEVRDSEIFGAIAARVLKNVSEFTPRSLSNILNAFSKTGYFHLDLFMEVMPQFTAKLDLMTPQCIGNTIIAYSKFFNRIPIEKLTHFFNQLITGLLNLTDFDSFIGQNYANILSGISKIHSQRSHACSDEVQGDGLKVVELFSKLSGPMKRVFDKFNHVDVLMVTNSMSRCRVVEPELLGMLLVRMESNCRNYRAFEVVNALHTLSTLYEDNLTHQLTVVNYNGASALGLGALGERIKKLYLYFLDHFAANLDSYNNLKPLDIRLVFATLPKCGIRKEYSEPLLNRFVKMNRYNLSDVLTIVNYYLEVGSPVPSCLHTHVLSIAEGTLFCRGGDVGELVSSVDRGCKLALKDGVDVTDALQV